MIKQPSIAIVLDKRYPNKNKKYPVKLRITFNGKYKYYSTGKHLSNIQFENVFVTNPKTAYRDLRKYFNNIEEKAISTLNNLPEFTFGLFDSKYRSEKIEFTVFNVYKEYIDNLLNEERYGTAESYNSGNSNLKCFAANESLKFYQIDNDFLKKFHSWMKKEKELSDSSIGIYMRNLRSIFNYAIKKGYTQQEYYPFRNGEYKIPRALNIKKALTKDEIKLIFEYKPEQQYSNEHFARDIWFFSYLCNGMNFKDISLLKYKNIVGNRIEFNRAKTGNTRSEKRKIIIPLKKEINRIIELWGNKPAGDDKYIFHILSDGLTPEQAHKTIKQWNKLINKYLSNIAKQLKLLKPLKTYSARHSFSTILKQSGVSIEFISESLGHQDLKTTEKYLDSFDNETKAKYADNLTSFLYEKKKK